MGGDLREKEDKTGVRANTLTPQSLPCRFHRSAPEWHQGEDILEIPPLELLQALHQPRYRLMKYNATLPKSSVPSAIY
jgi:hypothetical protein